MGAFLLACETFPLSQGAGALINLTLLPFVAFGMIFAWGMNGLLFFVGLAAFLSFFILAYQFLHTTEPKALFMVLYVIGLIYCIPETWAKDFVVWKAFVTAGGILIFYIVLAYILPRAVAWFFSRGGEDEPEG